MPIQAADPSDTKINNDSETTVQAAAAVTTGVAGAGQTGPAGISGAQYEKYLEDKERRSERHPSTPSTPPSSGGSSAPSTPPSSSDTSSPVTVPAKYSRDVPDDRIVTPEGGTAPVKSLENIIQVETTVKTTSGEEVTIVAPLSKFNQEVKDQILTPELVKYYNTAQIQAANQKDPVPLDQTYDPYSHGTTREIPVSERPGVQEAIYKIYDETGTKVTIPKTAEQTYQEEQYTTTLKNMGAGIIDFNNGRIFVDTYIKDPVGRINPADPNPVTNKLFDTDSPGERIDQWIVYEGKDATKDRAISSAYAPVELGLTFLPSFGTGIIGGAVIRGGGAVLGKMASSGKVGSIIANVLTKPFITSNAAKTVVKGMDISAGKSFSTSIIKAGAEFAVNHPKITLGLNTVSKAVTTPTNAALNIVAVSYGIDVVSRVNAEPTLSGKFTTAAKIAILELPALIIGGKIGYSAVTKTIGRYETRGLTALKSTDFGYEIGIPNVKNPTISKLQTSFEKSTYIPSPYKYSNTITPNIKQPNPVSARLPESPSGATTGLTQYTHATPYGEAFKKPTVQVQKGSSEAPGMYVAPAFNFYYAKAASELPKSRFFMTETLQTSNPATVAIYGNAPKAIPYGKMGLTQNKKGANTFMSENAKKGEVYLPNIKEEMEGIITVGTEMTQLPTRFYFNLNGVRVPTREFKISATPKSQPNKPLINTPKTQQIPKSDSSSYAVKYQYPSITSPSTSIIPSRATSPSSPQPASSSRLKSYPSVSKQRYSYSGSSPINSSPLKSSPSTSKPGSSYSGSSPINSSPLKSSPSTSKPGSSYSTSSYKSPSIPSIYIAPSYKPTGTIPQPKRKKDDLDDDLFKRYKPLRREVLHHLSIIDPAEAINAGSFTGSRKRPERIINTKNLIYEISSTSRTKRSRRT